MRLNMGMMVKLEIKELTEDQVTANNKAVAEVFPKFDPALDGDHITEAPYNFRKKF